MNRFCFAFLISLFHLSLFAYELDSLKNDFRFQKLPHSDSLSHIVIRDIIQDKKGFIWIATSDGLNRYDGNSNKTYRPSQQRTNSISHFYISNLIVDNRGALWVGTEKGLNQYNAELDNFEIAQDKLNREVSLDKVAVSKIYEDSSHRLWIGTRKNGVFLISRDRKSITPIHINNLTEYKFYAQDIIEFDSKILVASRHGLYQFDENKVELNKIKASLPKLGKKRAIRETTLFKLSDKRLLVGTKKGLYSFDSASNTYKEIYSDVLNGQYITKLLLTTDNQLFVGTRYSGLIKFELATSKNKRFTNSPSEPYSIIDNQILAIFQSNDNLLWLGTNLGVNIVNLSGEYFGHILANDESSACLSGNTIYAMLMDSDEFIWVASWGHGLHKIDLQKNQCEIFRTIPGYENKNILANVVSLHEDNRKNLWISTFDNGLIKYSKGANKFNLYNSNSSVSQALPSDTVNAVSSDANGNIWIATSGAGLAKIDSSNNTTSSYSPEFEGENSSTLTTVNNIYADKQGIVWLATQYNGLVKFDIANETFTRYLRSDTNKSGLPPTLLSVDEDPTGMLWIGTRGYGAVKFDPRTESSKDYSVENGLFSNVVMGVKTDSLGNQWIYTDNGLSRLSSSDQSLYTYFQEDGMQSNSTTGAGFYNPKDDSLWVAGVNGFNIISLSKLSDRRLYNPALITNLELFYKPVPIGNIDPDSPLKTSIISTEQLEFNYDQNVFSLRYSALEFENPDRVKYAFMLEGYDEWNYVDSTQQRAVYTNVDPGEYVFKVKASNNGNWGRAATSLNIIVNPPWWKTNFAYFSYLFLIVLSIYLFVSFRTKALVKRSKELEKSVVKRTKELAEEKTKVELLLSRKNEEFANVSHEFRTPLTLILGPLSQVLQSKLNNEQKRRLNVVQRNGYRLLRMVEQLLNLETFRIKSIAQKSPQAIGNSLHLLAEAFKDLATEKQILFNVPEPIDINFEFIPDAFEKIVVNLLSNAIKYSKPGGKIDVNCERTNNNEFKLTITDTGIGIPESKVDTVFERYARVLDDSSEQITGSGIGLALVKELVKAHLGSIVLESELGKGTTIVVTLPIINEVKIDQVNIAASDEIVAMEIMGLTQQPNIEKTTQDLEEITEQKNSVLLIEDNVDMRNYIKENINSRFKVFIAANGEEGVKVATEEIPDLIISDIMMPKMDGYEVTKQLRCQESTNHIPIVLLTARSDRESRLKGWQEKADEYLTKPFDVEELLIRLDNLLEIREILKKRFSETAFDSVDQQKGIVKSVVEDESDVQDNVSHMQQLFIEKLNGVLDTLYQEQSVSITEIADKMAMSDRQLQRKLKSILDLQPVAYLRRFRLEKSKALIAKGKSVQYTSVEVGFSSQSYFGVCFKAQFGLSPKAYYLLKSKEKS
ncbi:hybrid sensor histidine kinase/response regulator transcription factor [Aliikangiella coralliicola]|uniref:histidine kinase n=1 Tax=Aliikangiella coralliicola TaxID=2592383 RepID=A0A545UJS5_9GAMM|nr:hybrid sensor histidine kinase/response regulator transcription factor [Aliikangiella coralliicola]TQV89725.1 response regulator [Aliikangiella coralliicola]